MRLLDLILGRSPSESSRRIGLVLGGGAMRGAAHLGVLQVFEEEGIQPDIGHTSFVDFGQTDLLVEKGREAALAHLVRIKSDLGMTPKRTPG